mgnify:CR=1 FL=1
MDESGIPIGVLAMMFGIGFVGVLAHWVKAALNKQATWNLFKYLFVDKPGASGSMIAAYSASMWGLYSLGAFDVVKLEYISEAWASGIIFKPFAHAIIETVTAGYICDSAFNRAGIPGKERRAEFKEAP